MPSSYVASENTGCIPAKDRSENIFAPLTNQLHAVGTTSVSQCYVPSEHESGIPRDASDSGL
jgi:hypothetical protein